MTKDYHKIPSKVNLTGYSVLVVAEACALRNRSLLRATSFYNFIRLDKSTQVKWINKVIGQ